MNNLAKKISAILVFCFIMGGATIALHAERGNKHPRISPNTLVSQTFGTARVKITYGRSSVNGRNIFGGLVSYGKVWRTGPNESTVIVFSKEVPIEGDSLEAGTYSLYPIPGKDKWTIIINSKRSWRLSYDKNKGILRVQVEPVKAPFQEQFMIYFKNVINHSADMVLHWTNIKVPFTIEI